MSTVSLIYTTDIAAEQIAALIADKPLSYEDEFYDEREEKMAISECGMVGRILLCVRDSLKWSNEHTFEKRAILYPKAKTNLVLRLFFYTQDLIIDE